jgi:hypothetical protein
VGRLSRTPGNLRKRNIEVMSALGVFCSRALSSKVNNLFKSILGL